MLRRGTKYKEVIFGVLFGVGASLIDVAMHTTMRGGDWLAELLHPTLVMAAYRTLFLVFGVGLGILLWQRNRTERDFRRLSAAFDALRRELTAPSMLVHTNLQLLLTRHQDQLSPDATAVIRAAYENSTVIQRVLISAPRAM
ncbi:MAG: hypothetical protein ROO76_15270 [Terriglobia bacterium]|jgi:hypothetical protein|nr:hypothetical protein [Terriglobia bacterium]